MALSEKKRYRTWMVQQKLAIVLAGLRGDRWSPRSAGSIRSPRTCSTRGARSCWTAGAERLSGKEERTELAELRKRVGELERSLGRKTYELEILGDGFRTWE
jgi:hypothetical protein